MFPLASAQLPLRRNLIGDHVEPEKFEDRPRVFPLTLVTPLLIAAPMMSSPSPLSRTLDAMLNVLDDYIAPPFLAPPPGSLPSHNVLLDSVVERTVGLGDRLGTDLRGPFSVAALKGLRVEAVVRYELWGETPADVGPPINDLIQNLLGDRDRLRAAGFLRIALKSTSPSENVFAEDAYRQNVQFEVLFEFPYVDADGAESLIARIPIDMIGEFNETTTVVDEMARWDNESTPTLAVRGPLSIGAFTALAFIPGPDPTGEVTLTRTFDGATGAPGTHSTLPSFVTAVAGNNPAERHAEVTFASLADFIAAIATFKITDGSLAKMGADPAPVTPAVLGLLEGIKDVEVAGESEFLLLVENEIGAVETTTHKSVILKHSAILEPILLGDWDLDGVADEYESVQFRISPSIQLTSVTDRLEIAFEHPELTEVAVVYLRASTGPGT